MLLDGDIDLLAGLALKDDRTSLIGYPNEIMGRESYYLVKYDEDTAITADPVTLNGCRIGMSADFQKTIFEPFTREKTSTVSGIQGTGLGMAIAKNLIEMMGGAIILHSTEGKGSEFTVELPCKISRGSAKSDPGTGRQRKSRYPHHCGHCKCL